MPLLPLRIAFTCVHVTLLYFSDLDFFHTDPYMSKVKVLGDLLEPINNNASSHPLSEGDLVMVVAMLDRKSDMCPAVVTRVVVGDDGEYFYSAKYFVPVYVVFEREAREFK